MNIALFGCGPHAKRIYISYMKQHGIEPRLIVDIESARASVIAIVKKNNWKNTKLFFVSPSDPYKAFSDKENRSLKTLLSSLEINKAIISTPPEVHIPYAILCLEENIKVLIDKPLSAPRNLSNGNSQQIVDDLYTLKHFDTGDNIIIQAQRRRHIGYKFVKNLIQEMYQEYGIQPHFIDIYHSDGRWDFPDEIPQLTNHPYAYGYGKLLHSGYHFVDLISFLTDDFQYDSYKVTSYANTINDFKAQVPDSFYKKMFDIDNSFAFPEKGYGEIDSYSLLQFVRDNRIVSTISMNLLHTGFSKRAWGKAKMDLYKGNGRLRHERVNIQIGPLINIQIHSYQSTEIHNKNQPSKTHTGGLEHFEIQIYRNSDLIGGKPLQIIQLADLEKDNKLMLDTGQNEFARHQLVTDFLEDNPSQSGIESHVRTNILLASIAKSMNSNTEITGDLNNV